MQQDGAPWLVKSSGRVIGPFSTERIAELLRSREISVLDEVSKPIRRWQTIQYHDEFKEIVESMRKANLSERTEANWTPTGVTSNLTQTLTDATDGDLTEEISDEMVFTSTAKEIVIHNIQEQRAPNTIVSGRFQPSQIQNTAIQRQVEKTTRGLWMATILILLMVFAFIAKKRMNGASFEVRPTQSKLKQNVVAAVQVGHYAEALKELKGYFTDPNQAGELAIYYGSLLIQVENQTTLGRRLLNQVLSAHRPETKQAYTGLGVADLIDGQLDSAQENFEKALALDSSYVPALVNESAMYIQKGDYSRAKQLAQKALQLSPRQGEALLSLAEAQLYLYKVNNNAAELGRVNKMLKDFLARQWDHSAEVGFYSLYFDYLHGDKSMEEKLTRYLDRDPELTSDHRHNVFIYRGRAQWKVLARFCEQMTDRLGESARVSNFLAACYSFESRWDSARRNVEKAVNQSPRDGLVQAWYSLVMKESGDPEQASVVLGRANEYNRRGDFLLPALLQARFCQMNKDVECARENWTKIYERNLDSLPAVAGMAWVYAQRKTFGEAVKLIDKGLRISPDYIPLLELRQQAEREGWYASN
jgi:tetratricopeptide (TPR) repeat protein